MASRRQRAQEPAAAPKRDKLVGKGKLGNPKPGRPKPEVARLKAELREALEQQTAMAEVLQVINASPGRLEPVFDVLLERATLLCEADGGVFTTHEGGGLFRWASLRGFSGMAEFLRDPIVPHAESGVGRVFRGETIVHILDSAAGVAYDSGNPGRRVIVELGGARTQLCAGLRKDGALLGAFIIWRREVRPFSDRQIALLQNFAAQAVIAMENARLLGELRTRTDDLTESLEYQTATSKVLEAIGRSTSDIQPVLETMLSAALRLCRTESGGIAVQQGEGFRYLATLGWDPEADRAFRSLDITAGRGTLAARVIAEGRIVQVADVASDPDFALPDMAERAQWHTALGVPLIRDDSPIGVIAITRNRVEPFTKRQIALVKTFADQAVIAMENARLLGELRQRTDDLTESLEYQTATSEVLELISRSTSDIQAVLDSMVATATRLCGASAGTMAVRQGNVVRHVATTGLGAIFDKAVRDHPLVPGRGTISERVLLEKQIIHVADLDADPDYPLRDAAHIDRLRTALGVPLMREGEPLGVFAVARDRIELFTARQIGLVKTFADQAVIAIENSRLFEELRDRQAELRVTFDNMGDGVAMFDAEPRLAAWNRNFEEIIGLPDALLAERPSYADYLRLLAERGEFGSENVEAELASRLENTDRELRLERTRADGTVIEVRRNAVPGGGFVLIYSDVTEQRRAEAAIRAARDDAEAALERQTATADILKVIASSPSDSRPAFEAIAQSANRLLEGRSTAVWRFEGDKAFLESFTPLSPEADEALKAFSPALVGERPTLVELRRGQVVHVPDTEKSAFRSREIGRLRGFRAQLFVPLLALGKAIGFISVTRKEASAFNVDDIQLLQTFADQAVIAIQNTKLFTDLSESLEQQTATSEILTVISQSPTDVGPVLSAVAKAAMKFCGANDALVALRDGDEWSIAAHEGPIETMIGTRRVLTRHTAPGRAMTDGKLVQIKDLQSEEGDEFPEGREIGARTGFRSALAAPLLRDDVSVGAISLRRREAGEFEPRQVELLKTFAAQAVIAIQNVRLFTELRESLEQQTATAEILRAISQSPTDVQPVLTTIAKAALRFCGAADALICLRDGESWIATAHEGVVGHLPGARSPLNRETAAGRSMIDGLTCHMPNIAALDPAEFASVRRMAVEYGFAAVVAAPLLRDGVAIGSVTLRKVEPEPFTPPQIGMLETFAAQAVIAIENVRLFTELRDSLERLKAAQANLIQAEKMASLGQLTAGIAHEIKNPLNFVNNFAGLSSELLDELKQAVDALLAEPDEVKRAELQDTMDLLTGNLARIVEHGRRADGIVKSMLAHSRGGTGDWQESNVNALVEEALNLAYHGARAQDKDFNVTLERDFGEARPIEVVPQDVTRVFLNLFGNGFYATRKRDLSGAGVRYLPTLTISTRDLGEAVEVRVRDNGTGIPPEVRTKLFQPFFTTKPTGEGTGLGLSISYDIVTQQHGGSIEVESEPGSFTEFTVRLPRRRRAAPSRGEQ